MVISKVIYVVNKKKEVKDVNNISKCCSNKNKDAPGCVTTCANCDSNVTDLQQGKKCAFHWSCCGATR